MLEPLPPPVKDPLPVEGPPPFPLPRHPGAPRRLPHRRQPPSYRERPAKKLPLRLPKGGPLLKVHQLSIDLAPASPLFTPAPPGLLCLTAAALPSPYAVDGHVAAMAYHSGRFETIPLAAAPSLQFNNLVVAGPDTAPRFMFCGANEARGAGGWGWRQ